MYQNVKPTFQSVSGSPDGLGAAVFGKPAGIRIFQGASANGFGATIPDAGGFLVIALQAAAGYFAGLAMAPSSKDGKKWGVIGAINAPIFGVVGLGVQGLVSRSSK